MEWKIGEIKQINGEWYQCVRGQSEGKCTGCFFKASPICIDLNCLGNERKDHTKVIFKKLEKVGEPYAYYCPSGRTVYFQRYKTYHEPVIYKDIIAHKSKEGLIDIEIKQNKEDMEEKKIQISKRDFDYLGVVIRRDIVPLYTTHNELATDIMNLFSIVDDTKHSNSEKIGKNLKEFSLEAAKSGKPVCTRNGRKARIICFDAKGDKPIIALVEDKGNHDVLFEKVDKYFINGHSVFEVRETDDDLMMLPEKKEGWVNLRKEAYGDDIVALCKIYKSQEEAVTAAKGMNKYIGSVKIEWEE